MKDDDFRDWRREEEVPREPDEGLGPMGDAEPVEGLAGEPGAVSPLPNDDGFKVLPQGAQVPVGSVQAQAVSCPNCRYNLTGVTIGMPCPECGLLVGSGSLGANGMPTSARAIASLVLGIIGLVGCCMYGLSGIVCGGVAVGLASGMKEKVLRGEVHPSSQGLAMAGFVCGLIGLILGVLYLGVLVLAVVANW